MNDYPLPRQAVGLWLVGDTLHVRFPPAPGHDKAHVVHLHASVDGLKNLLVILRQREVSREEKLGAPGVPTQYVLDKWAGEITRAAPKRPRSVPAAPRLTLDDLELDL